MESDAFTLEKLHQYFFRLTPQSQMKVVSYMLLRYEEERQALKRELEGM